MHGNDFTFCDEPEQGRDLKAQPDTKPAAAHQRRFWRYGKRIGLGVVGLTALEAVVYAAVLMGAFSRPHADADDHSAVSPVVMGAIVSPAPESAPAVLDPRDAATEAAPQPSESGPAIVAPVTQAPVTTGEAASATPAPVTSSVSATPDAPSLSPSPAVGEPASETPVFTTPEPSDGLAQRAATLAAQIEASYGVEIARAGQNWGDDEAEQMRNLSAVSRALAGVPPSVRVAVANSANGPLTFLSNSGGRTLDGWQPYGDREANFYTNEDQGASGHRASNQVVLQPGSTAQTVTHELMHAYQMRNIAPGGYVMALLTPEMKSFMAATGWRQTVSDDVLIASAALSWDDVNAYFEYDGRALDYTNAEGDDVSLFAPNPLEAFAEAGGLYYGRASGTVLPDWAEYWGWFEANVGEAG